jgi:hypothetical protein
MPLASNFRQAPGRLRLRPNRGFPLGLARQRHPKNSRSDDLIVSRRAYEILNFRITRFLSYADGRALS